MTRRRWFEAPVDQPWIARVVCAFPKCNEVKDWWRRLRFWLTHGGQWSSPEPGVDWPVEPNMGPPWPETEWPTDKEKTL